jgi:hypothetical protein
MRIPVGLLIIINAHTFCAEAQPVARVDSFHLYGDVKITIDRPEPFSPVRKTIVCFFALPNGNSTGQTMGKKMQPGDDWHFDIQHIRAQTAFIRRALPKENFIVIYLENKYKSWPTWKQKHPDFPYRIPHMVDSLANLFNGKSVSVYLNGHSGGGSFIFGFLAGVRDIPVIIKRISFLDSDYGYDSSYYPKLKRWIGLPGTALNVFAYNDSIVIYNGKPLVSPTGGTWYRSRLLLKQLKQDYSFEEKITDSITYYSSPDRRIRFFFKQNIDGGIYHTQQVELNGFIHSVLLGTKKESSGYKYYGKRAYYNLIR